MYSTKNNADQSQVGMKGIAGMSVENNLVVLEDPDRSRIQLSVDRQVEWCDESGVLG
jgi:hypothetical protein